MGKIRSTRRCSPFEGSLASSNITMFPRVFSASVFNLERLFGMGEGWGGRETRGSYEEKKKGRCACLI